MEQNRQQSMNWGHTNIEQNDSWCLQFLCFMLAVHGRAIILKTGIDKKNYSFLQNLLNLKMSWMLIDTDFIILQSVYTFRGHPVFDCMVHCVEEFWFCGHIQMYWGNKSHYKLATSALLVASSLCVCGYGHKRRRKKKQVTCSQTGRHWKH